MAERIRSTTLADVSEVRLRLAAAQDYLEKYPLDPTARASASALTFAALEILAMLEPV